RAIGALPAKVAGHGPSSGQTLPLERATDFRGAGLAPHTLFENAGSRTTMKGYFSSLAKQSSVSIRGGQTSGSRLRHAPMTETLAPLHSETILFVDSTPATVGPVHESQTTEQTSPQGTSMHPPGLIESPNISNQGGSASLAPREISKT